MHRYWKLILFATLSSVIITCENFGDSDTTPPVVSIQSPLSGATISEISTILVSTSDNDEIEKVEFYINDSLHFIDQIAPYEYKWNTSNIENGSQNTIKAVSYDPSNNFTESQPVLVIVDNLNYSPPAVDIISISYNLYEIIVKWYKSNSLDFSHYNILYSESVDGSKEVLATIYDRADTSYTFSEFDPTQESWYWISVLDTVGLSSIGNEYFLQDSPPTTSTITSIDYTENSFHLIWTQNMDDDFHTYQLFESLNPDMTGKTQLLESNDRSETEFSVPNVNENEYRYFEIVVTDLWQLESISPTMTGSSYPKIAFSSDRDGNQEVYLVDINGYGLINLTSRSGDDSRPTFSNDGSKIAVRFENDGIRDICVMESNGSHYSNLTNNTTRETRDENPEFSPDGSQIVFTSYRDGEKQIYIMNSDGSGQTNLSNSTVYCDDPHFSPNGDKILFYRRGDIYIMNLSGGGQQLLSNDAYGARFSPNGSKIVFTKESGVFTMNNDGSNQVLIASGTGMNNPTFSPDGSKIMYTAGSSDIYIMDANGANRMNLTNNSSYDWSPNFSPDGSLIVFCSDREGNGDIYTMNIDGSNQTNLTNDPENDKFPVFQP